MISLSEKKAKIQKLNAVRLISFAAVFIMGLAGLIFIKGLFMTLLLASVISISVRPLADLLCRFHISRGLAVFAVFVAAVTGLSYVCVWSFPFLSSQFLHLKTEFPVYIEKISLLIARQQALFESNVFALNINLAEKPAAWLSSLGAAFFKEFPAALAQSLTILSLAPFFAYFMAKSELGLSRNLFAFVPNPVFEMILGLHHKINQQIGVFVRAKLLEALCVGLIVGVGLSLVQFPFAVLLAVFAGCMNIIPYLGPLIGAVPVFLVGLANGYEPSRLALIMAVYFSSQVIDYFVLVPFLLARIVNLHPLTVIIIIIAGAQFMGIAGMIISIPLANALKVSVAAVHQHLADNI